MVVESAVFFDLGDTFPLVELLVELENGGLVVTATDCQHETYWAPAALPHRAVEGLFILLHPLALRGGDVNSKDP